MKKTTVPKMKLRGRDEASKEKEENVEEEEEEGMEDLEAMALQFLAGYYQALAGSRESRDPGILCQPKSRDF